MTDPITQGTAPPSYAKARLALAGALLGATALLAGCGKPDGGAGAAASAPAGGMPPAAVTVEKVAPVSVPVVYEYVGQAAGARDVEVRSRVTGILLKRNFAEGGMVNKGQLLYSLDEAPFQAVLARAEADVASNEARLAQSARTLARLKPLWEARAVSQREFDDAASAEQIARAELKGVLARRAEAQLQLGYTRVEAPIGGLAGRSQLSEGSLVTGPDLLLTTVTQTHPIKLRFGISDTDQSRWRSEAAAGQLTLPPREAFEVEVRLADGSIHPRKGRLVFSDTRVSASTGTVEAEAELPNPDGALKPGQFVRVRLLGASRPNAVLVPSRAVLEGPQGKFVYLMDQGKAMPRPVAVGEQSPQGWIVTKGLAAGDAVIVDGMARIFFPGAAVRLAQAAAPIGTGSAAASSVPASAASK